MARSISFVAEGDVDTKITITELDDGTLRFDLIVLGTGSVGDLRALFFDMSSVDVAGLSTIGADVTDTAFEEGAVDTLGKDANIKGSVTNELGDFDVGIEFGTSGLSNDDIQATSFVLDHNSVDLTLDMLDQTDFGLRYTSVGAKIGDQSNGVADNDVLAVTENEMASIDVLINDTNGATNAVTGVVDDEDMAFTTTVSGFERTIIVGGLELGVMTVTTGGVATFDANGADVDSLEDGELVGFSICYTTTALDGSLASAKVAVTVTGTADSQPLTSPVQIKGIDGGDISGGSVSAAGDIDNDGLSDVLIGALFADPDGRVTAGESYLVFGSTLAAEVGDDGVIDLATLTASEGILIKGSDTGDRSGDPVSSAGDVDNDGLDDILIGAVNADPDGSSQAGETYLIFGATLEAEKASDGVIDLATLTASEGVLIKGIDVADRSGVSVSSAGDVDNDGLDDIIIGAWGGDPDGSGNAGESYLIFGSALAAEKTGDGMIDLATLATGDGILFKGIDANDNSGLSVASAGDVDNDGLDDILIGALRADPDGTANAGESYLVFGSALAAEKTGDGMIDLATLTTSEGVLIKGIDVGDVSGIVSLAGDVDNDGLSDILIGAQQADPDGSTGAGESYLVFGATLEAEKASDGVIDLATLTASEGVLIKGIDAEDTSAHSVSYAGDVDNDGLDDIIIGAYEADPDGRLDAGETYLVFGATLAAEKAGDGVINLATLTANEGILIKGIDTLDGSGESVSSAGDVDNDGLDDIIIGSGGADPDGTNLAGESYVISGAMLSYEKTDDGIIDLGDWLM